MEKKTKKVNKLCSETQIKIRQSEGQINIHLINFANKYREIWEND